MPNNQAMKTMLQELMGKVNERGSERIAWSELPGGRTACGRIRMCPHPLQEPNWLLAAQKKRGRNASFFTFLV
jgi:hypothetical protein